MTYTMDYRVGWADGWLCLLWEEPGYNQPVVRTIYYPVVECSQHDAETSGLLNREAIARGASELGLFEVEIAPYGHRTLQLKDGGSTKPIRVDEADAPAPKVRRGTETRWNRGRWEKLSKREGWIAA